MSQNSIIGVAGRRGHGKTTWIKTRLARLNYVIIADSLGEYTDVAEAMPLDLPSQLERIEELAVSGKLKVACPMPADDEEKEGAIDYLCREAYQVAIATENEVTLVIEEADHPSISSPQFTNAGLNLVIQYGRHAPVSMIWTARNLGAVSRRLTSETDYHILFKVQEPRWLEAIADRFTPEIAERVSFLDQYEYILIRPDLSYIVNAESEFREVRDADLQRQHPEEPPNDNASQDSTREDQGIERHSGSEGVD